MSAPMFRAAPEDDHTATITDQGYCILRFGNVLTGVSITYDDLTLAEQALDQLSHDVAMLRAQAAKR